MTNRALKTKEDCYLCVGDGVDENGVVCKRCKGSGVEPR